MNGNSQKISAAFVADRCRLMAFIRSMVRDHHAAEDLFQEVWLRLHQAIERGEDIRDTAAWCRGTAKNLVLHHWRSQGRSRVVADSEVVERIEQAFAEQDAAQDYWREREVALRQCMDQLPEKSRTVLALKYYSRLTSEAVGARLGKTAGAVMVMLTRIRQVLEDCVTARLRTGVTPE